MNCFKRFGIVVLFLLFVRPLVAVNVQAFYSSPSRNFGLLEEAQTETQQNGIASKFVFNLGGAWVKNPLVLKNSNNSAITGQPLPSLKTLQFAMSLNVLPWLAVGSRTAYGFFDWKSLDALSGAQTTSGSASGLLDVEVNAKMRVIHEEKYVLAIMPFVTIPTNAGKFDPISGDSLGKNAFLSDEGLGLGIKVIGDYHLNPFLVNAHIGYKHNKEAKYGDLDNRSLMLTGVGVSYSPLEKLSLNAEYVRQWAMPFSNNVNPNELSLGVHAKLPQNLLAYAALSLGNFFDKADGSSYGFNAGLKYVP